ncbi:hypothetical protein JCM10207_006079 [Rhodosporidiobolus poonsookiae]
MSSPLDPLVVLDSFEFHYASFINPSYLIFLAGLRYPRSTSLSLFSHSHPSSSTALHDMSIINTGSSIYLRSADPRPSALRREATSNDLRLVQIDNVRLDCGAMQVYAKSVTGLSAWHDYSRVDPDTAPILLGDLFSKASFSEILRYTNLARDALHPPAAFIVGAFYLQFTAEHLRGAGSPALTLQQASWDALVDTVFEGRLQNDNFKTNYVPIRRSPRAASQKTSRLPASLAHGSIAGSNSRTHPH